MAKKEVSLYLEDFYVRLLITQKGVIKRWVSVALEEGLVSNGEIQDENKVAEKVAEAMKTLKKTKNSASVKTKRNFDIFSGGKKLVVGISGRGSLYRVLSIPVISDNLVEEMIRREAGRVFPVSLDDLYISYQKIPGLENEIRVFVAAFPKKNTDALLRVLRTAGLQPASLDLVPLALCNTINEPRSIMLDLRQDNLSIVVLADRVPQVIRCLPLQSEIKSLVENIPTIAEEFSRTVAFYNSSHQNNPLDETVPVFVSGELTQAPDKWKTIVEKLNSNVSLLPKAIQCPEECPAAEYEVNLALATKELLLDKTAGNYSIINLNALPAWALIKHVDVYNILFPIVAVVGISAVVLLWFVWQDHVKKLDPLDAQIATVQKSIANNAQAIAKLTEENRLLSEQIPPIKEKLALVSDKLGSFDDAQDLVKNNTKKIFDLTPDGIYLENIKNNLNNPFALTGVAGTKDEILSYAGILRDTGLFQTVISSITYETDVTDSGETVTQYRFELELN